MVSPAATLLVPFRWGDDPVREHLWSWVRSWYQERHPRFEITVGTIPSGIPWSKGRAVQDAVRRARRRVWVVADADVIVLPDALDAAVVAVLDGAAWAQPHGTVYRLSLHTTTALLGGKIDSTPRQIARRWLDRPEHPGPRGGGITVVTPEVYAVTGGIDPRFEGWGGEDEAWARALDCLVGECARGTSPMFHLWHERQQRRPGNRGSEETERLAARYLDARDDVDAMRALVGEHACRV